MSKNKLDKSTICDPNTWSVNKNTWYYQNTPCDACSDLARGDIEASIVPNSLWCCCRPRRWCGTLPLTALLSAVVTPSAAPTLSCRRWSDNCSSWWESRTSQKYCRYDGSPFKNADRLGEHNPDARWDLPNQLMEKKMMTPRDDAAWVLSLSFASTLTWSGNYSSR